MAGLMVNFILGNLTPEENQALASDFNIDGLINISDVILLVDMILGNEWYLETFINLVIKKRI